MEPSPLLPSPWLHASPYPYPLPRRYPDVSKLLAQGEGSWLQLVEGELPQRVAALREGTREAFVGGTLPGDTLLPGAAPFH